MKHEKGTAPAMNADEREAFGTRTARDMSVSTGPAYMPNTEMPCPSGRLRAACVSESTLKTFDRT